MKTLQRFTLLVVKLVNRAMSNLLIWLVVEPPLWKIWVRQLGSLSPIYGKNKTCSKPPTSIKRNGICIGWFKNMTQENHGKSTNEHEWTITCKVSGKTFNVHHRSSWTTNSANLAPRTESETMFGPQKLTSEICCAESRGSRGFLFLLKKPRPNIPASDKTCLAAPCYDNPLRSSQLA